MSEQTQREYLRGLGDMVNECQKHSDYVLWNVRKNKWCMAVPMAKIEEVAGRLSIALLKK